MPASAGHHASLMYLWEDSFATDTPSDTEHKAFGADTTLNTLEGSHNATRLFEPNNREAIQVIEQNFSGSWSVDFTLTNPWWLRAIIAEASSSGSSAPYEHTFDGMIPDSFRLVQGTETTGVERYLLGCVATSASISVDVAGDVTVSLDGAYADEERDPDATLESQPTINEQALHFGHAKLEVGGDTLSLVQSVTLDIENNTDLIPEIGTRFPVDYSPKARELSLSFSDIVHEDDDNLGRFYGGGDEPGESIEPDEDALLVFDNGGSNSDLNRLEFEVTDLFGDSYGRDGIGDPTEDLVGNLSNIPAEVTVTAENSIQEAI